MLRHGLEELKSLAAVGSPSRLGPEANRVKVTGGTVPRLATWGHRGWPQHEPMDMGAAAYHRTMGPPVRYTEEFNLAV